MSNAPINIQVAVQFDPLWLKLGFRNNWQARRYAERIRPCWCHHHLRLDTRVVGTWVLIRIPINHIIEVVASGDGCGFYFRFNDPWIARRWEEDLLVFRRIRGSKTDLYVWRDISERELFGPGPCFVGPQRPPPPAHRSWDVVLVRN
ncbi:hypothetical protein TruAng_011636 [Truncatella angustata]|nr:hypothetical protein TruAng_011636 [Truncatella angustata]